VEDLSAPDVRAALAARPGDFQGFVEEDEPNFSFGSPPCSFYSGSKALAEKVLAGFGNVYVGRLRIPFDEFDGSRNYLSKLLRYPKIYENVNSLSHRGEFVRAALDLLLNRAPFGVYNMTNPGFVSTRDVVDRIRAKLTPEREFEFWENDEVFYREAVKAPRSNCILDPAKLQAAGVTMRPVDEALEDALSRWQWEEART
jgi:nucleoside-diphosphate-sugar epimerase